MYPESCSHLSPWAPLPGEVSLLGPVCPTLLEHQLFFLPPFSTSHLPWSLRAADEPCLSGERHELSLSRKVLPIWSNLSAVTNSCVPGPLGIEDWRALCFQRAYGGGQHRVVGNGQQFGHRHIFLIYRIHLKISPGRGHRVKRTQRLKVDVGSQPQFHTYPL